MRSFLVKAALAAVLISTTLAGAEAANRLPMRHVAPPTVQRIVGEANAAFQRASLARYNHQISSDQYDFLKSRAMAIKTAAIKAPNHRGVLSPAVFASLQARVVRLDRQIARAA